MKSETEGCGCLGVVVVGALVFLVLKGFYIGATGFFQEYGQLIFNTLFTVAVLSILAVRAQKRWTRRTPMAAFSNAGIAAFPVFLVALATRWWGGNGLSLLLSYVVASISFLIILSFLRRSSIKFLREQGLPANEPWKEHNLLLRLSYAPIWPVATVMGILFYRTKAREEKDKRENGSSR